MQSKYAYRKTDLYQPLKQCLKSSEGDGITVWNTSKQCRSRDFLTAVKTVEKYTREKALKVWNGVKWYFSLHVTKLFSSSYLTAHTQKKVNIKLFSNKKTQNQNNFKNYNLSSTASKLSPLTKTAGVYSSNSVLF